MPSAATPTAGCRCGSRRRFLKDLICTPDGQNHRIDVYSMVGLIPLFATEVIDRGCWPTFRGSANACGGTRVAPSRATTSVLSDWENERGEHLLAIVDHAMLPPLLSHLLSQNEFLYPMAYAASTGFMPSIATSACCPVSAKR